MSNLIVDCSKLGKTYYDGAMSVNVLNNIDFAIHPGDRISIVGPSGSGKSTLLHLLGGLDKPSDGAVCIEGVDWQVLSEKKRCQLRNQKLGFIYQFHHLLPEFSALENVVMPLLLGKVPIGLAREKAKAILDKVGLSARENHKPAQLSGGERQRVAIARALVHEPQCVFADEPTGNLDHTTALRIFELMLELNELMGTALVIVTHDTGLAKRMDRVMYIQEGRLLSSSTLDDHR